MKHKSLLFLFLVFALALILGLSACAPQEPAKWTPNGDGTHSRPSASDPSGTETEPCTAEEGSGVCKICGGEIPEHKHEYKEVVDDAFLKYRATCKTPAIYNKSCSCGKISKQVFEAGELGDHIFTEKNSSPQHLCKEGDCTNPALYYYSCKDCGKSGTETFEVAVAGAHAYGEWTYAGGGKHIRVCAHDNSHTETENCSGGKPTDTKGAICTVCGGEYTGVRKPISILAIGNSFSRDSMEYLYGMLASLGYNDITLGNLVHSGCTLEQHAQYAQNDEAEYDYATNTNGTWVSHLNSKMDPALTERTWDIITVQQYSAYSGLPEKYTPYLDDLLTHVASKVSGSPKYYWNMTWAYKPFNDGGVYQGFYYGAQDTMYAAILSTVQETVLTDTRFSGAIPVGTAIQNVRTSSVGQDVCRDNSSHLNYGIGRYTAALTWCAYLTGCDVEDISYVPTVPEDPDNGMNNTALTEEMIAIAKESVKNAVATPFSVTKCKSTGKS